MFLCWFYSPEIPKSNFQVELDAAKATWLSHDIVMFSSKAGEMLLLTVVYDGRYDNSVVIILFSVHAYLVITFFSSIFYRVVQRLDLMKSKASVLSSVGYFCTCVLICFLF